MDFCNKLRNKDSSNSMKELMAKLDNLCSQLSSSCDGNTEKFSVHDNFQKRIEKGINPMSYY